MNKWGISGLIAVAIAILAGWLIWRNYTPEEQPAEVAPPPAREVFHASKPIQVVVAAKPDAQDDQRDVAWLEHELRYLLSLGQMRVAPVHSESQLEPFTLRVEIGAGQTQARLALVAPDEVLERQENVALPAETRLGTVSAIASRLPQFLNAAHVSSDWVTLLGTDDAEAYETFLTQSMPLVGPAGQGFTQPMSATRRARAVERLETLTRRQPRFARAWAALATAYLSLGGDDEPALAQLAESSAERAIALDSDVADAHAALGLVHLRRNGWIAAREQFELALALDVNNAPALEGLSCLLVDAGQHAQARPMAEHAVALQPRNIGAHECLAYASAGPDPGAPPPQVGEDNAAGVTRSDEAATPTPGAGRVHALAALLAGDSGSARHLLRSSIDAGQFDLWADPLLRAASNRREIPGALQAITRAASDGHIDSSTEILCGVALRQAEFVFNRMSRLQRQREHVPLRVLWMPGTEFLRKHERFEGIISASGLPALWQEHGVADVCAAEPDVYGCKLGPTAGQTRRQ